MRASACLWLLCGLCVAAVVPAADIASPASAVLQPMQTDTYSLRQLVADVSQELGLDPDLMDALVRVESGYNPRAVSRKGAMGLTQLMPSTARLVGVDNPFDAEMNVRGGARWLSRLINAYDGNLVLALAAYNAGEEAVSRHGGVPPYRETREYVARVMGIYTGEPYSFGRYRRAEEVKLSRTADGRVVISNDPRGTFLTKEAGALAGALGGGFGATR